MSDDNNRSESLADLKPLTIQPSDSMTNDTRPDPGDKRIVYDADRERLVKQEYNGHPVFSWMYSDSMSVGDADLSEIEDSPWRGENDE